MNQLRALSVIEVKEVLRMYNEEEVGTPAIVVLKTVALKEEAGGQTSELRMQPGVAQVGACLCRCFGRWGGG